MGEVKLGEPFGLDSEAIKQVDWKLALARVVQDLRSDFIYAPHLGFMYRQAGDVLISDLTRELRAGTFSPNIPITIEVPKSFRVRVATHARRVGPAYTRPGSILLPPDRLLYQALADQAAQVVSGKTDTKRSFSHLLASPEDVAMFLPTRTCWSRLQKALNEHAKRKDVRYVLKIDVANYFGSLNQHTLINVLNDAGYRKSLSSRLEAMLTSYTGERSSRGILQGMCPSDLFGNFYLTPIDQFLKDFGVPSARYVDDIYVFVKSVDAADHLLRQLVPTLRGYDLVLNEAKSVIMPKSALITEEPDLDGLFSAAVDEIAAQVNDEDFDADYGFQSDWNEEVDEEELELTATTMLFDALSKFPGHEESIERFCLPLLTTAESDYAVSHVLDTFKKRSSMSQIYAAYLARFLSSGGVSGRLISLVQDESLVDWQRMWILAALSQVSHSDDATVKVALDIARDTSRHDALRAVAAIYVGRFGDHTRRKSIASMYSSVSTYLQAAIFFSSGNWPSVERANAKAKWGGHGPLQLLVASALKKV